MLLRVVVRRWAPWLVIAVALSVFLEYAFPGYMSFDSSLQLREARSGSFSDWHPPLMAEIWRWCDRIVAGPALMLLLQTGMFVAGIYLIAVTRMSKLRAAIVAAVILLFPPIATVLAVIWKDSQMIGFFALGCALLLLRSRKAQVAGVVLLAIGTAMRHNAFTITPAIVVPLFRWWPDATRLRRYVVAAMVWVALTGAAELANHALTSQEAHPWHGSVALFDITGMLRYAHGMTDAEAHELVGSVLPADMSDVRIKAKHAYSTYEGYARVVEQGFLTAPGTAEQRASIAAAWRALLRDRPLAYLHHRWRAFLTVLGIDPGPYQSVWASWDTFSPYTYESRPLQQVLQAGALRLGLSWLARPWIYLLVVAIGFGVALRRRDVVAAAFAASALVSEAALFFITPTPDFRYSIWLAVCSLLVPALLLGVQTAE